MSQEVLIPKMKRLNSESRKIKIPFFNILIIVFSILLIIGATFLGFDLKHFIIPKGLFSGNLVRDDFIYSFYVIPQIPILMLVCSSLGKKLSTIAVMGYLILGFMGLPIFALGGGLSYFTEYGCGYLLAYLPAVIVAGSFLNRKYSFLNMILASLCGVLIIHCFGILYMLLLALLKHEGIVFISGWVGAQSGMKIIYDIVFSFVFILIGKYINTLIRFLQD